VDRIIDVFPQEQQSQVRVMLSESLRGVIAQALLPKADGQGRVAVIEILQNTSAVANLIREGKTFQIPSAMQTGRNEGMITFDTYVQDLVKRGIISQKEAMTFLGKKTPMTGGTASGSGAGTPTVGAQATNPMKMPPPNIKKSG
jgi:twitching motility protein PilT